MVILKWFLVIAVHSYSPKPVYPQRECLLGKKWRWAIHFSTQMEDDLLLQKTHTMTVCMVPPESAHQVWHILQQTRTLLKDPGLYRWPPHVNLLYPFYNINLNQGMMEEYTCSLNILQRLQTVAQSFEPFQVSLLDFGTFGGKYRGCLWMYPKSFIIREGDGNKDQDIKQDEVEPLIRLQTELEKQFPMCNDVKKASGSFLPHLTLSQLPSLDDALAAKKHILDTWGEKKIEYLDTLSFHVEEIYILKRIGDDGQFSKMATIKLGSQNSNSSIQIHEPPLRFIGMPLNEDDWIRKERMDLKNRRNKNGQKRRAILGKET